jgi:hypothetical protein
MGLREDLQADMAEAFDTDLADAVQTFAGGITLPGTVDPVTEEPTGEEVIAYTGHGLRIKATDKLLIALTNEVVGGTPQIGHKINGLDVLAVETDPAGAHYEIQLREV